MPIVFRSSLIVVFLAINNLGFSPLPLLLSVSATEACSCNYGDAACSINSKSKDDAYTTEKAGCKSASLLVYKRDQDIWAKFHKCVVTAEIEFDKGKYKHSETSFLKAIQLCLGASTESRNHVRCERLANAYTKIGMIHTIRKNWPEAQRYYEKALSLVPENSMTLLEYGLLLRQIGEYERGNELFMKGVQLGRGPQFAF